MHLGPMVHIMVVANIVEAIHHSRFVVYVNNLEIFNVISSTYDTTK